MRLRTTLITSLFVLFSLATSASGQAQHLRDGDKIKLRIPSVVRGSVIGRVTELYPNAVKLSAGDSSLVIMKSSIQRLFIHRGYKPAIATGAILGGAADILVMEIWSGLNNETGYEFFGRSTHIALAAGLGLLAGSAIGAIIGSGMKVSRWERLNIDIAFKPPPVQARAMGPPRIGFRITIK